jgi:hypothetical protein
MGTAGNGKVDTASQSLDNILPGFNRFGAVQFDRSWNHDFRAVTHRHKIDSNRHLCGQSGMEPG